MKKFPRIYSLSTLGLIHHQEFDYKFHPLRTDFIGDSGSGKSMVSDLLQLIFVGSDIFESATKGTDDRKPAGMVLEQRHGRGTHIGYAFLNLEIKKDRFICIGMYLETSSRNTQPFIIQRGYSLEELTPMEQCLKAADFLKGDDILPIDQLKEYMESKRLNCQSWIKPRIYLETLFKNNILPLDLAVNDSILKDYAQILQAFSRGKTLDTRKSESLKAFLFGDTKAEEIRDKFQDAVKELQSETKDYGRNKEEIDRVTDKLEDYTELKKRKAESERELKEWLLKNALYTYQQEQEQLKNLKHNVAVYQSCCDLLTKAKLWATSELQKIQSESDLLEANFQQADAIFRQIQPDFSTLEKAQKIITGLDCDIEKLDELYEQNRALQGRRQIIKKVNQELETQKLTDFFHSRKWPYPYIDFERSVTQEIDKLKSELAIKNTLKSYSDLSNKDSLGYWAFNLGRPLGFEEESALIHYQKLPRIKPTNHIRYLPSPDEFMSALNVIEMETLGFWINLNGIREFVPNAPKQIFNTTNKDEIKKYFDSFSEQLDLDINELIHQVQQLEQIKAVFSHSESPKKFYETFIEKDNKQTGDEITALNISPEEFQNHLRCLNNAAKINQEYFEASRKYKQALETKNSFSNKGNELGEIQKHAQQTENTSDPFYDIIEKFQNTHGHLKVDTDFAQHSHTELIAKIIRHKKEMVDMDLLALSKDYSLALELRNKAVDQYQKTTNSLLNFEDYSIGKDPIPTRDSYIKAEKAYTEHFGVIIKKYLSSDTHRFDTTSDFLELGKNLLPEALRDEIVTEDDIIEKIKHYLTQINEKNRKLSSRKVQRVLGIVEEVEDTVTNYLDIIRRIRNFFQSDEKQITGGHKVKLKESYSTRFPMNWIKGFKEEASEQINLFSSERTSDLTDKLSVLVSLQEIMAEAYYNCGGVRSPKVDTDKLLDPCSYFDLDFSMESANGRTNIGSTGQTYAAIALLCIARLSVIGLKEHEKPKPGIRFMPIDEAEGLGSNFDLLYKIAKTHDYQIVSMSVNPVGRFQEGQQYVYMLHKNSDEDDPVNFTPMAILSKSDVDNE